jgi:hypothetical protein
MEIGELWIDPADELLMIYVGVDPDQPTHYGFFCPSCHDNQDIYYYSNYDLKYLRRVQ